MFQLGKLSPDHLSRLIGDLAAHDQSVVLGPGIGRDCAVLELGGDQVLVAKSDPITFATDEIGWYAVHVNANDVATTGAAPRWFLATVLLPPSIESGAIDRIFEQMRSACDDVGVTIVGGHTEVTYDLNRPIVIGTLLGLVARERLLLPTGAQPGDVVLLTKRMAVEATSIIAREKEAELKAHFDASFVRRCQRFLHEPGISVVNEARIAAQTGRVHAMHDPTEGGVATALMELAIAAQVDLEIDSQAVPIYPETQAVCDYFRLDPWGVIASGALLIATEAAGADDILKQLRAAQIEASIIGRVAAQSDRPLVRTKHGEPLRAFARDEMARLFE